MANDVLFRTAAFGGFKKDDVMSFVERILSEKNELEKQLAANAEQIVKLNEQISQMQSDSDEVERLRSENGELSAKIDEYESSISHKDDLIAELTQRASQAEVSDEVQTELQNLRNENMRLREENAKKQELERQVGAAMLDARVHSEGLVEAARERANNVTKLVYSAIGETAVKIDDLSAGIGEIARNFTKSVEEVELRIKVLTGDMSKTAQALIADSGMTEAGDTAATTFANGDSIVNPAASPFVANSINSGDSSK